jgi:hypothetical protein
MASKINLLVDIGNSSISWKIGDCYSRVDTPTKVLHFCNCSSPGAMPPSICRLLRTISRVTKVPHYGISNNIKGDTQHIIKYAGGKTSYRAYKNNKMISETILSITINQVEDMIRLNN